MIPYSPFFFLLLLINQVTSQIQPLFGSAAPRNGPCTARPPACALNCAHGFAWGLANECLCLCQVNPCTNKFCPLGERCQNQAGFAVCVRAAPDSTILRPSPRPPLSAIRSTTIGECPRLVGGNCLQHCRLDADCPADYKCCSNGCGFECVQPVNVAPIQGSLSIRPLGQLPQIPNLLVPTIASTLAPSTHDSSSTSKGACVHLLSAVQHLPQKHLQTGFVPTCTANGKFAPVQCDQDFCWCVNVDSGHELWGTKVALDERADLNCGAPRECDVSVAECERKSKGHCTFGWETDSQGCPSPKCECKHLCTGVECDKKFHECQLIEPDCTEPPCQPIPKCILNPCPNGPPATLNNGVTALCTSDNPCFPGYWCHEIGYNGLGFCCPEPEHAKRDNAVCEARSPRRLSSTSTVEESECRVDSDCSQTEKCCFNGAALKCTLGRPASVVGVRRPLTNKVLTGVLGENKALLSTLNAECPVFGKHKRSLTCETECQTSADCHGMRICCRNGCSQVCTYPVKTTACLHDAITFDLFGLRHAPRCNSQGFFHEVQCDQERCYCAEPLRGRPLPGTLVPVGHRPTCNRQRSCSRLDCPDPCSYGVKYDEEGCPTCECKNPCEAVQCGPDQLCMMVPVECTDGEECSEQPRCLPNICQGEPASDHNTELLIQCSSKCPTGFACIQFGLPGNKGLCCPLGISGRGGVRPTTHTGECPTTRMLVGGVGAASLKCRLDADCASHEKCCFDGKGTVCTVTEKRATSKSKISATQKPGECLSQPAHRQDCRSGVDECTNDADCAGILKCCSDGCYRKCLAAYTTTVCHHLKFAMEPFGRSHQIRCSPDGDFEPVQCDSIACWCADIETGREIDGTRVAGSLKPECRMRRVCAATTCDLKCPGGYKKDANGCSLCECLNVCQDLKCPSSEHICVAQSVKCLPGSQECPPVPRCLPNVCRSGHPLLVEKTGDLKECDTNGDCPSGSYCRRFGWRRGYCCGGPDNQHNAGKCPKQLDFPVYGRSCSLRCRQDNDCPNGENSCCFNGCGMECSDGDQKSIQSNKQLPVHSHSVDHNDIHHSPQRPPTEVTCPLVQDLGHSVCGASRDNLCESDKECPSSLKCCFDGCSRSCLPPAVASNCVHANAAVQALMRMGNSNLFQPLCTADGLYARVQRQRDLEWCVDHAGREVPGTRTNSGVANCDQARECRALTCQLDCEFGYQIDEDGCEQCACQDPCHQIQCPTNHVCRMVQVECGGKTGDCQAQPKCLLNVCLRGEPLTKANTRLLVQCNIERKQLCPPGWFCQQIGMGMSGGYCCAGIVPDSQLQLSASKCTPTPVLYSEDQSRQRRIECRLQKDCGGDKPCCFNGYGSQCVRMLGRASPDTANNKLVAAVQPESLKPIKPILSQSDRGTCPINSFHNPGCQTECHSDEECGEFRKCCEYGCGRKCLYPDLTSPCVHRLAVLEEEQLKRNGGRESSGATWTNVTARVQCASSRQYRKVQCQREIGQCWCVDAISGKEQAGTRASIASRGEPNCQAPRKCPIDCQREWTQCEHGVRLDSNGCPANNQCECRNPCEDFECGREGEVCVLRAVRCQSKESCPKQPTCRPSPCAGRTQPLRNPHNVPLTCRRDSECAIVGMDETSVECRALATSDDESGHKVGVCCGPEKTSNGSPQQPALGQSTHTFDETTSTKMGVCPLKRVDQSSLCQRKCSADDDCSGTAKCCRYGCSSSCEPPAPATNCMHMTIATEKLKNDGVPNRLPVPACDHELGTYVNNQCDEEGACWCVDKSTGAELTATRHQQPSFNTCESERRKCSVECSDDLTQTCPFGLDLDQNGCPKTSQCRCKNPCDSVDCPNGEICLLRSRDCTEGICLPVPQCEPNPCTESQHPLLEARGFSQFACFHNRTRPCPSNYQCTGFDQREIGICCPPTMQRSSLHFHQDADQSGAGQFAPCPHGPAYARSGDDPPTICSISGQNACPSTHYCVTKPGQTHGNCCPAKRFVCNLERDIATACGRPTTRFHFDPDSQQCVPFVFGGCAGNLNNFETETACQRFCIGVGSDPLGRLFNGGEDESTEPPDLFYSVGFSLTGPLNRQKHTEEFNERLRDYLMATYSLSDTELRDLYVRDDNTVRFNLVAPNAQQKAANISQAIASNRFHFRFGSENYHAEPQTWYSQQIDTNMRPAVTGALFWILLVASTLFALAVVFILWCACSFVRSRSKDSASIFRGVSPSPFGQISAYLPQDGRSSSASSRASNHRGAQSRPGPQRPVHLVNNRPKVQSADDLHVLQQMERENRQMSATPSALSQFLSNPLQDPRKIQRPKIIEEAGPSRKVVSGQKSTVFY